MADTAPVIARADKCDSAEAVWLASLLGRHMVQGPRGPTCVPVAAPLSVTKASIDAARVDSATVSGAFKDADARFESAVAIVRTGARFCYTCAASGPAITIDLCGRCRVPRYCSRACQVADWPMHKAECRAPVGRPPWTDPLVARSNDGAGACKYDREGHPFSPPPGMSLLRKKPVEWVDVECIDPPDARRATRVPESGPRRPIQIVHELARGCELAEIKLVEIPGGQCMYYARFRRATMRPTSAPR